MLQPLGRAPLRLAHGLFWLLARVLLDPITPMLQVELVSVLRRLPRLVMRMQMCTGIQMLLLALGRCPGLQLRLLLLAPRMRMHQRPPGQTQALLHWTMLLQAYQRSLPLKEHAYCALELGALVALLHQKTRMACPCLCREQLL